MEAVIMAFNMQTLESAQSKLATWICLFCTSVRDAVTAYEQRKMVWSENELELLPCLVLKLESGLINEDEM